MEIRHRHHLGIVTIFLIHDIINWWRRRRRRRWGWGVTHFRSWLSSLLVMSVLAQGGLLTISCKIVPNNNGHKGFIFSSQIIPVTLNTWFWQHLIHFDLIFVNQWDGTVVRWKYEAEMKDYFDAAFKDEVAQKAKDSPLCPKKYNLRRRSGQSYSSWLFSLMYYTYWRNF